MRNRILIIGAGIGGLALAQGLTRAGFDVTVFERDESPTSRPQGYRISIRPLGLRALTELLTPEQVSRLSEAKVADVGDGFTCGNEHMEPFFSIPQGKDLVVQFLRSELRGLLQEGIDIQWGKRLVKFEDQGNQVTAHFEDGTHTEGDLLVGCDGGGSIVRELLPSAYGNRLGSIPEVIDRNRAIFGGQIDRTSEWNYLLPLNTMGIVRFLGPSHDMAVCFSERIDRSQTVLWMVLQDYKTSRHLFDQGLEWQMHILDHCKRLINGAAWHQNLKKLVNETPVEAIMAPWFIRTTRFSDLNQFPIVPTGRVTLLGDSAHAMPADKGLGGNHVLEDARILSSLLADSPKPINWPTLIESFEREMFARTKIAVQESEHAAEYFRNLRSHSCL
jgi:2-polyprenyl-6-methoxyphenol hydroxylase-like FAD-dependent oxidoreductase